MFQMILQATQLLWLLLTTHRMHQMIQYALANCWDFIDIKPKQRTLILELKYDSSGSGMVQKVFQLFGGINQVNIRSNPDKFLIINSSYEEMSLPV